MHYYQMLYGDNSLQMSNCRQIQSTLALRLGQLEESVRWMEAAVSYFDNDDDEEKKEHEKSELQLIKVRYFSHFASVAVDAP